MNRKPHTPDEKAKLVLEALQGERSINEIASEHNVHPSMLTRWKKEAIAGLPSIFANDAARKRKEKKAHDAEMDELPWGQRRYCEIFPFRFLFVYLLHTHFQATCSVIIPHIKQANSLATAVTATLCFLFSFRTMW